MATSNTRLRVGILGAGEVAQVIHLPVLSMLSNKYVTTAVCDISKKNADYCAAKFHIPFATTDPYALIKSDSVDVVFILTSDEFHETYTIAALQAGKHVMLEKPVTLSVPSVERMIAAETALKGPRVFVGYMRRYASTFTQAFKREIASIPQILYARSRDFCGPNAYFVSQSGTFQVKNTDDIPAEASKARTEKLEHLFTEAFPNGAVTDEKRKFCRFVGGLSSHDISLLREALGFPDSVSGVSVNEPFYSAILNYRDKKTDTPFSVTWESGIDSVPDFDAHLAVYGRDKRVMIKYDSPYVKGLAITVTVTELNEYGEIQTRTMNSSYEDAYTTELLEMWDCFVNEKEIKTTISDAANDLRIFDMMYRSYEKSLART